MKKRKYNHPTFNHSHWIWYWDIYWEMFYKNNHTENYLIDLYYEVKKEKQIENSFKDLFNSMRKELFHTEHINNKNKSILQEELDELYPPLNAEYSYGKIDKEYTNLKYDEYKK